MLPIFNTLQIIDLGGITMKINTTKVAILIIAIIIIIIAINHRKDDVIFVAKKIIAQANI